MATFQSLGVGSGMELGSLVTQLVAAERAPKQTQITQQQSQVAVQISAMGTLKGALSSLQSALSPLKLAPSFNVFAAKSSDEEVFTASVDASAPTGNYDITVLQLATAQQLSSTAFDSAESTIGTGSLTLGVGEDSFTIEIDAENASLADIRDAINGADDNTGIRATIVNGTNGAHLVLTAQATGASNRITISTSGGDGGLDALTYSVSDTSNYTQARAPLDARIEIAGVLHTSASNTIKEAIEGVTLTLRKADPENTQSLDITRNLDTMTTRINAFVTQYNSAAGSMSSLQSYNATTQKAGPLLGDPLLRSVESNLRRELSRPVDGLTGDYKTLSSIGITMKVDGKLELDQAKLREAMESDFQAVQRLFSSESGVAVRMDAILSPHLSADGAIAQRNQSLDQRTKRLQDDQIALDARMKVIEQRYVNQFTALDGLLAQLQSTSVYLGQQLANLPKIGKE